MHEDKDDDQRRMHHEKQRQMERGQESLVEA